VYLECALWVESVLFWLWIERKIMAKDAVPIHTECNNSNENHNPNCG
jgi:hypothetical protein